ncbi:MAG: hypothetical protein KC897_05375 [Candidatus Omnitrophica bacterium]|nr:hypothetical protein [Candidatus Omnitrophota bacterium]MCB9721028.1 hypothetical protein [Candidatus Omnitrophota bacterium]
MGLEFLTNADSVTKVFWVCALGGTVFFTVRLILMIVGGDMDGDVDGDMDGDTHSDAAFEWISINTLTAFIMMFGWVGLTAYKQFELSVVQSFGLAFAAGLMSMWITAMLFRMAGKLVSKGAVFKISDTVGLNASVYQRIPAEGRGKVNVSLPGGILKELEAMSEDKIDIESFKTVKVVQVVDDRTISVRQI